MCEDINSFPIDIHATRKDITENAFNTIKVATNFASPEQLIAFGTDDLKRRIYTPMIDNQRHFLHVSETAAGSVIRVLFEQPDTRVLKWVRKEMNPDQIYYAFSPIAELGAIPYTTYAMDTRSLATIFIDQHEISRKELQKKYLQANKNKLRTEWIDKDQQRLQQFMEKIEQFWKLWEQQTDLPPTNDRRLLKLFGESIHIGLSVTDNDEVVGMSCFVPHPGLSEYAISISDKNLRHSQQGSSLHQLGVWQYVAQAQHILDMYPDRLTILIGGKGTTGQTRFKEQLLCVGHTIQVFGKMIGQENSNSQLHPEEIHSIWK